MLKEMTATEEGKDWDKLLPYVRTGRSLKSLHFELVYGRGARTTGCHQGDMGGK